MKKFVVVERGNMGWVYGTFQSYAEAERFIWNLEDADYECGFVIDYDVVVC